MCRTKLLESPTQREGKGKGKEGKGREKEGKEGKVTVLNEDIHRGHWHCLAFGVRGKPNTGYRRKNIGKGRFFSGYPLYYPLTGSINLDMWLTLMLCGTHPKEKHPTLHNSINWPIVNPSSVTRGSEFPTYLKYSMVHIPLKDEQSGIGTEGR